MPNHTPHALRAFAVAALTKAGMPEEAALATARGLVEADLYGHTTHGLQLLADYIEEFSGKLIHQGDAIESFADLWKAFSAVKAGSWGKKMREDLKYLFNKHVLPVLGQYSPRKITLTPFSCW